MKKAGIVAMIASICLLVNGCSTDTAKNENSSDESKKQTVENAEPQTEQTKIKNEEISDTFVEGKETVMIYMVGSDLESEAGLASLDINEMINSNFFEENLNVYLCTGGARNWWTDGISEERCQVYQISDKKKRRVTTLKKKNMAESDTLTEFVDFVYEKTNKKTDYYSMIFWDHGGGTILGFGADENYDYDTLSISEMNQAMEETKLIQDGKKLEWVGFDACLMGMLEVADMFSNYTDYFIASEELEGGYGWDYSVLGTISKRGHLDGLQAGKDWVDSYAEYYDRMGSYAPDYTLSCLDLEKVETAVNCLGKVVVTAGKELKSGSYSKIAKERDHSKTFGKVSNQDFYDTVDLYDLSLQLTDLYPEEVEALQGALDDVVVYAKTNIEKANGVAIYFPYSNKEYASLWMKEYEKIGFCKEYTNFLLDFTSTLTGEQLVEWEIAESAPETEGQGEDTYVMQLTQEQCENFGHAKYSIWDKDGENDTYICWLLSSQVSLLDSGKLEAAFEKKKFYIQDENGNRYDCTAVEMEDAKNYEKYVIPISVWKQDALAGEIDWIHVRVSKDKKDISVIGIYKEMNDDSMMLPNKNTVELKNGDGIYPFLFARDIVFEEDGSLAPFEQWKSSSGMGEEISYHGTLDIVYDDMDIKENTCCLFSVTDTQSNMYMTNPLYLEKE